VTGVQTCALPIFLGVLIAWILSLLISSVGIPMPPAPGMAHGFTALVLFTPEIAMESISLAVVTTLIAGLLPAYRASRLNIVDSIRYNQ
jgi:putative ABC transport system permease protein